MLGMAFVILLIAFLPVWEPPSALPGAMGMEEGSGAPLPHPSSAPIRGTVEAGADFPGISL